MRTKRDDGGPAFPRPMSSVGNPDDFHPSSREEQDGMSLRDYFAGCALRDVFWMWSHDLPSGEIDHDFGPSDFKGIAEGAYALADAMLAERSKP